MKTPKDQAGPAPDSLNARVARAIWGDRYRQALSFDADIERCRRDMLPALEKRGLGDQFYMLLAGVSANRDKRLRGPFELGFAVLKLGPRQWCEAFLKVWGEGAGG